MSSSCANMEELENQANASLLQARGSVHVKKEGTCIQLLPTTALDEATMKGRRNQPAAEKQMQRGRSNGSGHHHPSKEGSLSLVTGVLSLYKMFEAYIKHCGVIFATAAVVVMACAIRGDVLLIAMMSYKTFTGNIGIREDAMSAINTTNKSITQGHTTTADITTHKPILPAYLQLPERYKMNDLLFYVIVSNLWAQVMYHLVCGYLQWYYYVLQRDQPEKWKCQPYRFLTRSNEIHEAVCGTINMVLTSIASGFVTCWIVNGNYSTVYYGFDEYGYPYLLFSVVVLFLWFEAAAYYIHAFLHFPWVYKNVHKHHHRYHSPTAYSAVAMSPLELFLLYFSYMAPLFLFPINGIVFVGEITYVYYFSLIDHSGIKMESVFPWQPNTMFHDDHHRYFHCNFGFNSYLFDWLHGTLRRSDRAYGEDVFWGKGKKKDE